MKLRLLLLLLVGLGLAPGLFWRSEVPRAPRPMQMAAVELPLPAPPLRQLGPDGFGPELAAAWRLDSRHPAFDGFSSLWPLAPDRLMAISDAGVVLQLRLLDQRPVMTGLQGLPARRWDEKKLQDVESLTGDPASGWLWLGMEMTNTIRRYDPGFANLAEVAPPEMAGWPDNSGAEALTRLADGRFIVLQEGTGISGAEAYPALLFSGDPIRRPPVTQFRFRPPESYRATDMAQMPDGRVLILLRAVQLRFPPRFTARIVLADPGMIRPGEEWPWTEIARLESPALPLDNFEGLAIIPQAGGTLALWLISDNNGLLFQQTLLLRLDWRPPER